MTTVVRYSVVFLLFTYSATAQVITDSLLSPPDSLRPFTIENFYAVVLNNHPVVKQANLLSYFAKQELRLARGNFDPKVEAQYFAKNFGDVNYYKILNSSIKFPSVFPVDASIGFEQNNGKYLNPERFIPDQFNFQQFYAGVSLPLLRGLITDERRAALKQAELFRDMMEVEQVKIMNKLLLEAAKDYWQWSVSYYNFRLFNQGLVISEEIFRRVTLNYQQGEAAAIDTIQAKITLQQRIIERQEALLEFQNAGIQLSNYLWDSLANPLDLSLELVPVMKRALVGINIEELEELRALAKNNHPDLQKLAVKLQQLEVERKLAAEFLKPKLDVDYYFINRPFDPDWNASLQFAGNYKFGVDLSFPIFIRKERAKLAQTKLKISNTEFDRSFAERQILNQINATFNQIQNSGLVVRQQSDIVTNYNRLLQAELINLENGESDLFKINIQIEKVIQSQSKLIKALGDYEKQKAFLYWAAGLRRVSPSSEKR